MHLYLYVRGKFEQVEQWKAIAQGAFWKFRRTNNKTGEEEIILVQGALRPSVLGAYEYIFPKEALAEVCCFFGITENCRYGFGTIGLHSRHFCLRKIFGCKKITNKIFKKVKNIPPTFSTEEFERGAGNCMIPGVAPHLIGIKEDKVGVIGEYTQELL